MMTFENHVEDIVTRTKKRLNLLKAIRGQKWGASPETILYTFRTYVRPLLEYGGILYSHEKENILKKSNQLKFKQLKLPSDCHHGLQIHGARTWSPLIKSLKD